MGADRCDECERLRAVNAELTDALGSVMTWIHQWDPNFVDDPGWPAVADKADAALSRAFYRGTRGEA